MSKHDDHPVTEVRIKGPKVVAVCACGWKSKSLASETKAREEHAAHVKGVRK